MMVSLISNKSYNSPTMEVPQSILDDQQFMALADRLHELGSVAVAFSGGVDSAFLLYVARNLLGKDNVVAVTSISPSFSSGEEDHCSRLAQLWDVKFERVHSDEMDNPLYLANKEDRCYWCKVELMEAIVPIISGSSTTVVLGVNTDDLGEYRPGQKAAIEAGAVFPLAEAGYSKTKIREHSRLFGLPTWNRPQAACLSSRIPYGTKVSLVVLNRLDKAESALRELGFSQLRVRHYDSIARIELPLEDLERAISCRSQIVEAIKSAGYKYVTLDLEGFRSGNLNL